MEKLKVKIADFAKAVSVSASPILISGETGSGKSLIARYIYERSERCNDSFTVIPLSELPQELFESQLFGHKKGSFTHALDSFSGLLEAANNGTVVLEEIDCLPIYMQPKILRLIESGEYQSIGYTQVKKCSIRFIATVNKNLKTLVDEKLFRNDLYYRLNVLNFEMLPLRQRVGDLQLMIEHFSDCFARLYRRPRLNFTTDALNALLAYQWPGNIRELKAEIERVYVFTRKSATEISIGDLSADIIDLDISMAAEELLNEVNTADTARQKQNILDALNRNRWNKSQAARELGISRKHLYELMGQHNI